MKKTWRRKGQWRARCGSLIERLYKSMYTLGKQTSLTEVDMQRSVRIGRGVSLPFLVSGRSSMTIAEENESAHDNPWWPWEPVHEAVRRVEKSCANHDQARSALVKLEAEAEKVEAEVALNALVEHRLRWPWE